MKESNVLLILVINLLAKQVQPSSKAIVDIFTKAESLNEADAELKKYYESVLYKTLKTSNFSETMKKLISISNPEPGAVNEFYQDYGEFMANIDRVLAESSKISIDIVFEKIYPLLYRQIVSKMFGQYIASPIEPLLKKRTNVKYDFGWIEEIVLYVINYFGNLVPNKEQKTRYFTHMLMANLNAYLDKIKDYKQFSTQPSEYLVGAAKTIIENASDDPKLYVKARSRITALAKAIIEIAKRKFKNIPNNRNRAAAKIQNAQFERATQVPIESIVFELMFNRYNVMKRGFSEEYDMWSINCIADLLKLLKPEKAVGFIAEIIKKESVEATDETYMDFLATLESDKLDFNFTSDGTEYTKVRELDFLVNKSGSLNSEKYKELIDNWVRLMGFNDFTYKSVRYTEYVMHMLDGANNRYDKLIPDLVYLSYWHRYVNWDDVSGMYFGVFFHQILDFSLRGHGRLEKYAGILKLANIVNELTGKGLDFDLKITMSQVQMGEVIKFLKKTSPLGDEIRDLIRKMYMLNNPLGPSINSDDFKSMLEGINGQQVNMEKLDDVLLDDMIEDTISNISSIKGSNSRQVPGPLYSDNKSFWLDKEEYSEDNDVDEIEKSQSSFLIQESFDPGSDFNDETRFFKEESVKGGMTVPSFKHKNFTTKAKSQLNLLQALEYDHLLGLSLNIPKNYHPKSNFDQQQKAVYNFVNLAKNTKAGENVVALLNQKDESLNKFLAKVDTNYKSADLKPKRTYNENFDPIELYYVIIIPVESPCYEKRG